MPQWIQTISRNGLGASSKRAALDKHILARRAEKVDNTVHLQILNARFAKEVRAMLAQGLTMDQVGQELGMSSEEIFALP